MVDTLIFKQFQEIKSLIQNSKKELKEDIKTVREDLSIQTEVLKESITVIQSIRNGTRVAEYPVRILYPLEFSQLFGSDRCIILMAVVDANYCLSYIDVGTNGRVNDARVFSKSSFYEAMEQNILHLPSNGVFVADDAFPLRTNILKPYSRSGPITECQQIFNYRLSRARRIVENAFGILTSRFRIFEKPIPLATNHYITPGNVDTEDITVGRVTKGSWRDAQIHGIAPLNYVKKQEPDDYKNYFRMNGEIYDLLLHLVSPYITKENTNMREAIPATERFAVTLRFLATGRSFEDLKFSTIISPTTISEIVMDTCEAIIRVLKDYIKLPRTQDEWRNVALEFGRKWQFWNCIGAVDGKHINIVKPANSGSRYFNYKGYFSIVLMAIVNANYEFMLVDCGTNGRVSDGGAIHNTTFWELFQNNLLDISEPSSIPHTNTKYPYVFLGDDAFQMGNNFLKPYNREHATRTDRIFNYRLSRARRVVENAFGILVTRFGIFQKPIKLSPEKVATITIACCYLHNFLMRKGSVDYYKNTLISENITTGQCDTGCDRTEFTLTGLKHGLFRNPTNRAKEIRDLYRNYFNQEGQVDWQNTVI
ncbi:uncharacterized protein LOC115878910 [Sitophilus oryzae]|uniref:Uncharacterized protein LOC115878910 n=1 Tax=Sitophilus oryzae TaxID=7048 RepID=A0A6J2XKD8_SITOR|nr:uncharacterized protein LOC115878910 [Sitophilus oryzae]